MADRECVVAWTTLPADFDAAAFGRTLVEARLAACVSTVPGARSVYRWGDGIEEDEEQQVAIKTTRDRVAQLIDRIRRIHPYDVPEILVLPVVDGSAACLEWLRSSTAEAP